jgi:hypothetical protein
MTLHFCGMLVDWLCGVGLCLRTAASKGLLFIKGHCDMDNGMMVSNEANS